MNTPHPRSSASSPAQLKLPLALLSLLVASMASSAQAVDHVLTGAATNDWTTATWTNGVPNSAGDTVSYNTPTATLALDTLTLDANQTIGALINKNTGALTIASNGTNVLTMDGTGLASGTIHSNQFSVGVSPAGTAFIGRTTTANGGALTVNTAISMNSNLNIGAVVTAGAITINGATTNDSGSAKTLTFYNAGAPVTHTGAIGASGNDIAITTAGNDSNATVTLSGSLGPFVTTVATNSGANLVLSGDNTSYTGTTTITTGKITAQSGTNNVLKALGTSQVNLAGGSLFLAANGTGNDQTIITGDGITGNNVAVTGNATINVSRASGTFLGSTFRLNNLSIGENTLTVTNGNSYRLQFAGTTTLTGNATFNPGTDFTLTGAVGESGGSRGFTKVGGGTLFLNGNNTFTGGVTVNAGTLQLGNAGALNSTAPNALTFGSASTGTVKLIANNVTISRLNSNATVGTPNIQSGSATAGTTTLTVNNSTTDTYGGTLTNGSTRLLALTKSGSGSLTLSGVNTYTGNTTVSNGTLFVNGSLAATSAVSIDSGATLGGTGTVGTIAASGALAPSTVGVIGTLNAATLTWNAGNSFSFDLGNADNTSDKLALSGAFTKGTGSTFSFDFNGTGLVGQTYTLVTFSSVAGTTFNQTDFVATNLLGGMSGDFALTSSSLTFTTSAVPEPSTYAALAGALTLGLTILRRRQR